jgi:hypothetical protein
MRKIILLLVFMLTLSLVSCAYITAPTDEISTIPKAQRDYSTYLLTKATLVYFNEANEPSRYFIFTSRLTTIESYAMTLLTDVGTKVPDSLGTLVGTSYSTLLEFSNDSGQKVKLYLYCDALVCDTTSIGLSEEQTSSFPTEFRYNNYDNFAVRSIVEALIKMSVTNWVINYQNSFQL